MRRLQRFTSALAFAAVCALTGEAAAQSPSEIALAKQTAGEGLTAYNAGEFDKALGLFNQARKIYPSAQILRMIGYSELALEHWQKAVAALEEAIASPVTPLGKDDKKDVEDQMAKALAHLGTINFKCKIPGTKVAIDGAEPAPCPDKPTRMLEGPHKFLATAPDRIDTSMDLKVDGGKTFDVVLEPKEKPKPVVIVAPPPPPPPPKKGLFPHQREIGIGLLAGGAAAGIATIATFAESVHWRNTTNADVAKHLGFYGQGCAMGDPRVCAYDISVTNNEGDLANQLRNATIGLGVTALVLGAGGIVLIATAPKQAPPPADSASPPPPPPPVSMRCGPAGAGLHCAGTF